MFPSIKSLLDSGSQCIKLSFATKLRDAELNVVIINVHSHNTLCTYIGLGLDLPVWQLLGHLSSDSLCILITNTVCRGRWETTRIPRGAEITHKIARLAVSHL